MGYVAYPHRIKEISQTTSVIAVHLLRNRIPFLCESYFTSLLIHPFEYANQCTINVCEFCWVAGEVLATDRLRSVKTNPPEATTT